MAYTIEAWERTRALFESGQFSLSEISDKTGINKSQISRKAKMQQWQQGRNADYIESKVILATKKATENATTLQVLDDIADEAIRNKAIIHRLTKKALSKAEILLDEADNLNDIKTAIELTDRASITLGVNQRHAPKSDINVSATAGAVAKVDYESDYLKTIQGAVIVNE